MNGSGGIFGLVPRTHHSGGIIGEEKAWGCWRVYEERGRMDIKSQWWFSFFFHFCEYYCTCWVMLFLMGFERLLATQYFQHSNSQSNKPFSCFISNTTVFTFTRYALHTYRHILFDRHTRLDDSRHEPSVKCSLRGCRLLLCFALSLTVLLSLWNLVLDWCGIVFPFEQHF